MYKKYDALIKKMAWRCLRGMPTGYTTLEDLEQEGRLALMKMLRKRFKPGKGKFSTVLYKALDNRFKQLLREAYTKKRASVTVLDPYQDEITIDCNQMSAQTFLERKEMLKRIREVDEDIADLIEIGVSPELLAYARFKARHRALKGGTNISKISFAWKIIEKFYGIDLKAVIKTIHSSDF
jgi:DNA-directed RNA polymerase specialized sigma subunit